MIFNDGKPLQPWERKAISRTARASERDARRSTVKSAAAVAAVGSSASVPRGPGRIRPSGTIEQRLVQLFED